MPRYLTVHRSDLVSGRYTPEGIERLSVVLKTTLFVLGISERELARRSGVSNATVNSYVRGTIKEPNAEIIKSLAPHVLRIAYWDGQDSLLVDPESTYEKNWQALNNIATDQWRPTYRGKQAEEQSACPA